MTEAAEEIAWRVHPAGERKGMAALVAALILALSALAAVWMQGAYWGVFSAGVLFLSLEGFFLASRFTLGTGGVTVQKAFSRSERPWSSFRSAWFDRHGVTLSPYPRRHWLENYRALRLRYGGGAAAPAPERVIAFIRAHLDPERAQVHGAGPPGGAGAAGAE
jgi:hypothetical protein